MLPHCLKEVNWAPRQHYYVMGSNEIKRVEPQDLCLQLDCKKKTRQLNPNATALKKKKKKSHEHADN